ncbi:MAG TPA: isochorismatase family protein, partial [Dehalococcoidia bacterium]|nr:isochorismatase family protein [Dehalococcoidia bacterium]
MTAYDSLTALVVVDFQNDFADPNGSLYVQGGEDVLGFINAEIESARASNSQVVYSQDWHPETTPHFHKDGGIWPVHCVSSTWGAHFHPGLLVAEAGEVIRKGTAGEDGYSAFSVRDPRSGASRATQLESLLRDSGVERLVVLGLATDYCVKDTVLDARRLG